MLLFSFAGVLLLRYEAVRLLALLFQEPPRKPRDNTADCFPVTPFRVAGTAARDEVRSSVRAAHAPATRAREG